MFHLHDRTRYRICMAGFVLLCVVPTAVVVAWSFQRHLPGNVAAEAARLSRELGLRVSLAGVRHLRPGAVLYEGLTLADPETGGVVLRCRLLEAVWKEATDSQGNRTATLELAASQPEIEAARFVRLEELLGRLLRCEAGRPEADVRLTSGEVTLRSGNNSHTLTELRGSFRAIDDVNQAQICFRLAGIAMPQPIQIRVVRNRQTTPPTTGFELDTGGGAVPCDLLAVGLDMLKPLGPQSRFRGYVWANETFAGPVSGSATADAAAADAAAADAAASSATVSGSTVSGGATPGVAVSDDASPDGWDMEVTGGLIDVDLDSLVSSRFPHKLSGTGQVTIQWARVRRGRLEDASGTLVAGPGITGRAVVSRSLIDAAVGQFGMVRGAASNTPGDLVPYEQLALAFLIDSQGVRLQGRCAAGGPGAVLIDRYSRLLSESPQPARPVVTLLQMLVPANELQVPATRQTEWLMRHLPVAQIVPSQGAEARAPQARVRMRD